MDAARLRSRFHDLPLRRRLAFLVLLTSGGMLLASTAIVADDLRRVHTGMVGDLATLGDILAPDAAAAVIFQAPEAARETLAALKARPSIVAAVIYTPQGAPFASYLRRGAPETALPAAPGPEGLRVERQRLLLSAPLVRDGTRFGMLTLVADRRTFYASLRHHAAILGVVLLGSILLGLVTRAQLKAMVSDPLQELSAMAGRLAAGDLSTRVAVRGRDELGLLAETFNRMAAELASFQETLEAKVEERTRELRRSNKDLEQFAYVASHDLQEPLRKIMSFTQILAQRYRGRLDAETDQHIEFIVGGAARMQALIRDLLAYARVGRGEAALEAVDCAALLEEVLGDLAPAIEEGGAAVTSGPLPTVPAVRLELAELFQNLLSNALKFRGRRPPRVHVSARGEDGFWVFSVQDNGIGLDPQYAERVFVIFQRLHARSEYPGTGLGLAICKKIVESCGGRIWVESAPGAGATFRFTLPMEALREVYSMRRGSP